MPLSAQVPKYSTLSVQAPGYPECSSARMTDCPLSVFECALRGRMSDQI